MTTRMKTPPAAQAPAEWAIAAFVEAIEARRLDDAVACLAEDARFVTPDGTVVSGRIQLRGMIRQVLAMPSAVEIAPGRSIDFGHTAVATQIWTMRFRGPDGGELERTSTATLALCEGRPSWRLTLVAPWGLAGEANLPAPAERQARGLGAT